MKEYKEIDQRGDKLIFECNCGGSHFILFDYYQDESSKYKHFTVAMVDKSDTILYRIKKALRYILKGGNLYYMDIGLTELDLNRLIKLINDYKKI